MNALWKKVIVIGTGKSGIAAAGLLLANGAEVVLFDENTETDQNAKITASKEKAADIAKAAGRDNVSDRILMVCGLDALTQEFGRYYPFGVQPRGAYGSGTGRYYKSSQYPHVG